ncbi:bifunctional proline dehydrogenase/L-glutamate gamma-semialdehyde dehydrogenase PutA [Photobacterium damselae]
MLDVNAVLAPTYLSQSTLLEHWKRISPLYCIDEDLWLTELLKLVRPTSTENDEITTRAKDLVGQVRADRRSVQMIDALLLEYSLDTDEGITLMCLAEALMRIPDTATADKLLRDKLSVANWYAHLQHSNSVFVNASTWGLMLTGKVATWHNIEGGSPTQAMTRLVNKLSEPVVRKAMQQAMKIMGHQFVLGRTIDEALDHASEDYRQGYRFSFDMLGEAALTKLDANKYYHDYLSAIEHVAQQKTDSSQQDKQSFSISIKLSALHPRYEMAQAERVLDEMYQSVLDLLIRARQLDVAITIDAEESDRLELSLLLFQKLYQTPELIGWGGFGLVVQAYSKRALAVLVWLAALAQQQGDQIPVRLVKGAYWDSEIKLAQQRGIAGYPVFTRKEATDCAYLACARFLLQDHISPLIYPQFATHNAHTIAAIEVLAKDRRDYEFQRLHGMGKTLYQKVRAAHSQPVRVYAPVGSHKDLLPYLVRRLLENGANSSFVHRLIDAQCDIEQLVIHPYEQLMSRHSLANNAIALPPNLFAPLRKNSQGVSLDIASEQMPLMAEVALYSKGQWQANSIIDGKKSFVTHPINVTSPFDNKVIVGERYDATSQEIESAIKAAAHGFLSWSVRPVEERCQCLLKLADLLEIHQAELIALCQKEAGKTWQDSIDEIREAVDFCRYYAVQAETLFNEPQSANDYLGRSCERQYQAKGVFVCISPWNFPLAIFMGQITAALVSGNSVIAKPAEQTSLIATRTIELMFEAGVPSHAIQLLIGSGQSIGPYLLSQSAIAGVAFTGSTQTAHHIAKTLAERECLPATLIAETGGLNAMIVDSTALPEQVVRDVIRSSFASAGQRCSALRVLYIQDDISQRLISLLQGAMEELVIGDPQYYQTDIGPVIDQLAYDRLTHHIQSLQNNHQLLYQCQLNETASNGFFVPPTLAQIGSITELTQEHFGPILHVVSYKATELDQIISDINSMGFGLTLGIHSRNEATYHAIAQQVEVGNCYINRDQIGAVVGVQPFGGHGLSGTGPKAGGPHYLYRFVSESLIYSSEMEA